MADAALALDLQDGFRGEHVTVSVGPQVALDVDATTSLLTGLAVAVTVPVPAGHVTVSTRLLDRDEQCAIEVTPGETLHLGIALVDGQVTYRRSDTPFFYG